MTGIDGSAEMLALAKGHPEQTGLKYTLADLTKELPLTDDSIDAVLMDMVIMDIPRIDIAISEFARLLVDNGILVFSITHPSFSPFEWETDEKGEKLYKKVFDYLTHRILEMNVFGKTIIFIVPYLTILTPYLIAGFALNTSKSLCHLKSLPRSIRAGSMIASCPALPR